MIKDFRRSRFAIPLLLVVICSQIQGSLAAGDKPEEAQAGAAEAKSLRELRQKLAEDICQDDSVCTERANTEAEAVDAIITIAQNFAGSYKSSDKNGYYDHLRQWTLDFDSEENSSLQDYLEKLELATIQLQPDVQQAMSGVISMRPAVHSPVSMLILPNEVSKTSAIGLLEERDALECNELCKMGTEDARTQSCIGYCEQLVKTTVELQKLSMQHHHRVTRPNSLLFEGIISE